MAHRKIQDCTKKRQNAKAKGCSRNSAFSLVELLIVAAIFALLAALLQSALRKTLAQASSVACTNNIKQLALYNHQHLGDYNAYPAASMATPDKPSHWANFWTYDEALGEYDGRSMTYSDDTIRYGNAGEEDYPEYRCPMEEDRGWENAYRRSYAMNTGGRDFSKRNTRDYWLGATTHYDGSQGQFKYGESDIADPAGTLLMTELRKDNPGEAYDKQNIMGGGQNGMFSFVMTPNDQQNKGFANEPWHEGRWNYLFCDGHVESLYPIETLGPKGIYSLHGHDVASGIWTRKPGD